MQNEVINAQSLRIVAGSLGETALDSLQGSRESSAATPARPMLRGRSHAVAAVAAAACAGVLLHGADGDWVKGVALLVYGLTNVLLYGVSALYHMGSWSPRQHAVFRRLDHATIFVMIAGCYTPVAVIMLTGWWRLALLAGVWALTGAGVVAVTSARPVARHVRVSLYFALGFTALLVSPTVVAMLGVQQMILPLSTAILSVAGGLVYTFRRPVLWPRVFGYHELFHLVSLTASSAFFLFVLQDVVPYVRR